MHDRMRTLPVGQENTSPYHTTEFHDLEPLPQEICALRLSCRYMSRIQSQTLSAIGIQAWDPEWVINENKPDIHVPTSDCDMMQRIQSMFQRSMPMGLPTMSFCVALYVFQCLCLILATWIVRITLLAWRIQSTWLPAKWVGVMFQCTPDVPQHG